MRTRSTSVDNNQIIEAQNPAMNSQIRYPSFNSENPELFFEILESLIKIYSIPKDQAFLNIFVSLPYSVQSMSKHLLSDEVEDPISEFKKIVDDKFKIPLEEKLKKIINSSKSSEMKPSAYLLFIRDTLGKDAEQHKDLIRSHFIDSLPKNMGPIIQLLSPDCSLDLIANAADKQFNSCEINSAEKMDEKILKQINSAVSINEFENKISQKLEMLQKQISSLQDDIQNMKSENKNNNKSRFRSVSREARPQHQNFPNRRRSQSFNKPVICYWHNTFKEKSFKCTKPCDFDRINGFQSNSNSNNNSGNF